MKLTYFDSPLGEMLAIGDEKALYILDFVEGRRLKSKIERLKIKLNADITTGTTAPIRSIIKELRAYFAGKLRNFTTPLQTLGSPFQQAVWRELTKIPYGETRSYTDQARAINKPSAYRAVANANGANKIAIVIPCHRIINNNGKLGGYGSGVMRKQWLLDHESKINS